MNAPESGGHSGYRNEPAPEEQLEFLDRASWRAWLEQHHDSENSVWLIFHKQSSPSGMKQLSLQKLSKMQ